MKLRFINACLTHVRLVRAIPGPQDFLEDVPNPAFEHQVIVISTIGLVSSVLLTIVPKFEGESGDSLPKISEAMDGRSEAHMDVLVAFFGRESTLSPPPETRQASAKLD